VSGGHEWGPGSGGNRDRRAGNRAGDGHSAPAPPSSRSVLAAVPLSLGELRIVQDGDRVDVQLWGRCSGGRMLAGALRMSEDDLRLARRALGVALWCVQQPAAA
jgi:hypothetical protein